MQLQSRTALLHSRTPRKPTRGSSFSSDLPTSNFFPFDTHSPHMHSPHMHPSHMHSSHMHSRHHHHILIPHCQPSYLFLTSCTLYPHSLTPPSPVPHPLPIPSTLPRIPSTPSIILASTTLLPTSSHASHSPHIPTSSLPHILHQRWLVQIITSFPYHVNEGKMGWYLPFACFIVYECKSVPSIVAFVCTKMIEGGGVITGILMKLLLLGYCYILSVLVCML